MHVGEGQHGADLARRRLVETRFALEARRVRIGGEHHVPQRQVAEVAMVHATLVMQAVRLGPLEEQAEPAGVATLRCWTIEATAWT